MSYSRSSCPASPADEGQPRGQGITEVTTPSAARPDQGARTPLHASMRPPDDRKSAGPYRQEGRLRAGSDASTTRHSLVNEWGMRPPVGYSRLRFERSCDRGGCTELP